MKTFFFDLDKHPELAVAAEAHLEKAMRRLADEGRAVWRDAVDSGAVVVIGDAE